MDAREDAPGDRDGHHLLDAFPLALSSDHATVLLEVEAVLAHLRRQQARGLALDEGDELRMGAVPTQLLEGLGLSTGWQVHRQIDDCVLVGRPRPTPKLTIWKSYDLGPRSQNCTQLSPSDVLTRSVPTKACAIGRTYALKLMAVMQKMGTRGNMCCRRADAAEAKSGMGAKPPDTCTNSSSPDTSNACKCNCQVVHDVQTRCRNFAIINGQPNRGELTMGLQQNEGRCAANCRAPP